MKYIEIANELEKFVKWPDDNDRSIIGTQTAISFAEHIAKTVAEKQMKKWDWYMDNLRRIEREACAKACDIEAQKLGQSREALIAGICAASIRERGKK